MKLDIIFITVIIASLAFGIHGAYTATIVYVFLDFLPYQFISPSFYRDIPVSKIVAILSLLLFFLFDRKPLAKVTLLHLLMFFFAAWVTLTTTWAVNPERAWLKWDWAFKSALYAAFLPFVLRTRERIEGIILTIIFAVGASILVAGIKTANGGGGYGSLRRLIPYDFNIGESSTLSIVAVMMLPLIMYVTANSVLLPPWRAVKLGFYGLAAMVPLCVIGTYARAGLVAFAAWAGIAYLGARRKVLLAIAAVVVGIIAEPYLPDAWRSRMETIEDYEHESSATTRLAVWKWTLEFTAEHPFGGGFDSYVGNLIQTQDASERVTIQKDRAFHSSYFEILGEQGYIGLVVYLAIVVLSFTMLVRMYLATRRLPEHRWMANLAYAIGVTLAIFLAGAVFVGIAYQAASLISYALVVSLWQIYYREIVKPRAWRPPTSLADIDRLPGKPEAIAAVAQGPAFRPAKPYWRRD